MTGNWVEGVRFYRLALLFYFQLVAAIYSFSVYHILIISTFLGIFFCSESESCPFQSTWSSALTTAARRSGSTQIRSSSFLFHSFRRVREGVCFLPYSPLSYRFFGPSPVSGVVSLKTTWRLSPECVGYALPPVKVGSLTALGCLRLRPLVVSRTLAYSVAFY